MATPGDPAELALVVKAITCGVGGCCEWDERAARRFRASPPLPGLTPEGIKDELMAHVGGGGDVIQVGETRPEWNDRPFYYKVVLFCPALRYGLFIEIVLDDNDPDLPAVRMVNCHEQTR